MKRLMLQNQSKYIWQKAGWPKLTWQLGQLAIQLANTRFCQGKLISRITELGLSLSKEAQAEVMAHEAVKTSAVEGTIVNIDSVRSSVAKRLGLPAAGLPLPDRYADGIVEVLLDATVNSQRPLTTKRLMGWQAALFPTGFAGIHRIRVGKWRGKHPMRVVSGPMGHEKIHYEAPPYHRVEAEMRRFIAWWAKSSGKVDGLIRAGVAHFYFVTIHPFEDGNGRIARALTDMALSQDEGLKKRFYSLSSQIMVERNDYYNILELSQKNGVDITKWLLWFLGCVERAMINSEKIISKITAKSDFWKKHTQVEINHRQRKVINILLDAGPGGFAGGLTTRKYVSIAKISRVTAYREISELLTLGLLKQNEKKGRNASYDINWMPATVAI